MLLKRLTEYAEAGRIPNMAPAGYLETPVRYVIDLDEDGHFVAIIDQAQGNTGRAKRGKPTLAPHVGRSSAISAKLLADNGEYALGLAREPEKAQRASDAHQAFVELVRVCAAETQDRTVAVVLSFLNDGADLGNNLPADFDPSMTVTFRVGEVLPIDRPAVRAFWARRSAGETDNAGETVPEPSAPTMQCLVCGQHRPPMERLTYKWKGIPGGQTSGLALISANAQAFESYGLEASLIAPTCADCGEKFSKAANALLEDRNTSLRIGPLAYMFWTRELIPGFSVSGFLEDPQPEQVGTLLGSPRSGQEMAADLDATPFYAAALSASGARVVVRDWLDTTVEHVKGNLHRYFALQRIVGLDGAGSPPMKLLVLAGATVRELKDLRPEVTKSILRLALAGSPLPLNLLTAAIHRCQTGTTIGDRTVHVTRSQAALIKMVILSTRMVNEKGADVATNPELVGLDQNNRKPAYLCGRLLAVLEATQRAALGDVNATIVDRYYGTASSAPASVFGRLVKGAQPHLSKLRRDPRRQGAYYALQNRLMDILNEDSGLATFPLVLDLPSQGMFALGYYHQRAADRAAARSNRSLAPIVRNDEDADGPIEPAEEQR